jgi:hypothetical protein
MNNERRKGIGKIQATIGGIKDNWPPLDVQEIINNLETLKGNIEDFQSEEQDYYDNMPESLQGGEKGSAAEAAVEALGSAVEKIDELLSIFEGIPDALDEALGELDTTTSN